MGTSILTLPLQLMTTTEKFGSLGIFSLATILYMAFVTGNQAHDLNIQNNTEIQLVSFDHPLMMIQNLGLWTFSVYLLDTLFLIKKDMKVPTEKNIMIVGTSSVIILCIPY